MRSLLGSHDLLFVTLDTLRYDVAADLLARGRTPNLARVLPGGAWERRHTPASFTYAAHHAFFGGFLPTPAAPGPHERPFAARFPGSTTVGADTWVFDAPDVVTALRAEGYHTICLGGVGFFAMTSAQGTVLPGLFDEAHWEEAFGVTDPSCFEAQLERLARVLPPVAPAVPVFTFVNVAAMHQPNRHYRPGAAQDCLASHGAALEYVDRHLPTLLHLVASRGRPCRVILCSDHGTAYGEDGHTGHRFAHDVVWTVPYAEFTLEAGAW
ncbi:STM4013/SEN3800 family hydrolase [Dactylosporangium sp. NPDC048998]|uniref:STM4013/SEN3800 family hydrolase n=1 Tax=Dactylosporangium sp. NPDC048998 TaxID=3363976 RepID=UPI003724A78E